MKNNCYDNNNVDKDDDFEFEDLTDNKYNFNDIEKDYVTKKISSI